MTLPLALSSAEFLDAAPHPPSVGDDLPAEALEVRAHGPSGRLTELMAHGSQLEALRKEAALLPHLVLTDRQRCDLELILNVPDTSDPMMHALFVG